VKIPELDEDTKRILKDWHEERGWECEAHSEGQECCLDILIAGRSVMDDIR